MDVRLFAAVMSRFKKVAIVGVVAAVALSALAYMRAGGPPTWEAQAEVLISQPNDPYGAPTAAALQASSYLGGLSGVYSAMANGDAVQAMVRRAAGVPTGVVEAAEVVDPQTGYLEPLITLTSSAPTAVEAVKLAEKMPSVLQQYIASQQKSANLPSGLRVQLDQVKNGSIPVPASSSSITVPLLVFMGVIAAFITLVFMLENLNPKTAEKLGRVDRTNGGSDELAAVLANLVQNQHSVTGPAPTYNGTANMHDQGPSAPTKPRTLRLYEESPGPETNREGFSTDSAAPDAAPQALRNRLLRGRE